MVACVHVPMMSSRNGNQSITEQWENMMCQRCHPLCMQKTEPSCCYALLGSLVLPVNHRDGCEHVGLTVSKMVTPGSKKVESCGRYRGHPVYPLEVGTVSPVISYPGQKYPLHQSQYIWNILYIYILFCYSHPAKKKRQLYTPWGENIQRIQIYYRSCWSKTRLKKEMLRPSGTCFFFFLIFQRENLWTNKEVLLKILPLTQYKYALHDPKNKQNSECK